MEAAPDLEAALVALRSVGSRVLTSSEDQLVADGAVIEQLGRLVDAYRVASRPRRTGGRCPRPGSCRWRSSRVPGTGRIWWRRSRG